MPYGDEPQPQNKSVRFAVFGLIALSIFAIAYPLISKSTVDIRVRNMYGDGPDSGSNFYSPGSGTNVNVQSGGPDFYSQGANPSLFRQLPVSVPDQRFNIGLKLSQGAAPGLALVACGDRAIDYELFEHTTGLCTFYNLSDVPDGVSFYAQATYSGAPVDPSKELCFFDRFDFKVKSLCIKMTRFNGRYYQRGWIKRSARQDFPGVRGTHIQPDNTKGSVGYDPHLIQVTFPRPVEAPFGTKPFDFVYASSTPGLDSHAWEKW